VKLQETVTHIPQRVEQSSRPMKVVLLTRDLKCGGAQRQLVVLAKGLHARGHKVVVAQFYSGGPLEQELLEQELLQAGVRIRPLQKRGRWDLLPFLLQLARVMREERPEILYSYLTDLVALVLKPWFPSTKIVWGIRSSNEDLGQFDWFTRISYKLTFRLSRFADAVIANSRVGRNDHIAQGYPREKTVVIPNGIDTQRFCPDPEARRHVRFEWGIQGHEVVIGIVARLDPVKDHPTFLQAASLLTQKRNHLRFVCVGTGPAEYRDSLLQLTRSLKLTEHVIWPGGRSDMPAVFNALDLLVSSSTTEGFSNVIAEAMACGVPCVATNVGDSAWLMGNTGEVVPPRDPDALTKALGKLLDQRLYTPMQIRRRIVEQFSVEKLVADTEAVLLKLLDSTKSVPPILRSAG
jgi:glycosyltransferase involved in cell wall biosynthesis